MFRCSVILFSSIISFNAVSVDVDINSVPSMEQYMKRYNVSSGIKGLGSDLAGDNLSLSNGALSFLHQEVSLPGNNNLDVSVYRSFSPTQSFGSADHLLADWQLELPRIEARTIIDLDGFIKPFNERDKVHFNCDMAIAYERDGGFRYTPKAYSSGLNLVIPNRENSKMMLKGVDPYNWSEQNKTTYVTQSNWEITCDENRFKFDDESYQGFIARSPEGNKYYFNQLVFKKSNYIQTYGKGGKGEELKRPFIYEVRYYVDKVVDKFGNSVSYSYSDFEPSYRLEMPNYFYPKKLTNIKSSDGRSIDLIYTTTTDTLLKSIKIGEKVWNYSYLNGKLNRVTLPEEQFWAYSFNRKMLSRDKLSKANECTIQDESVLTLSVTTPESATLNFKLKDTIQGRTGIEEIYESTNIDPQQQYPLIKRCIQTLSLEEKSIEVGGETYTWKYAYSQNKGSFIGGDEYFIEKSFSDDLTLSLSDVKYTKVTYPNKSSSYHIFDRRSLIDEAKHQKNPYENKEIFSVYKKSDGTNLSKNNISYSKGKYLGWTGVGFENTAIHTNYINKASSIYKEFYGAESSAYETVFLDYDGFGLPKHIKYISPSSKELYVKKSFSHDLVTWSLNRPEKVYFSEDNNVYSLVEEYKYNTFKDLNGKDISLVNQRYLHARLVEEFDEYHPYGLLKKTNLR